MKMEMSLLSQSLRCIWKKIKHSALLPASQGIFEQFSPNRKILLTAENHVNVWVRQNRTRFCSRNRNSCTSAFYCTGETISKAKDVDEQESCATMGRAAPQNPHCYSSSQGVGEIETPSLVLAATICLASSRSVRSLSGVGHPKNASWAAGHTFPNVGCLRMSTSSWTALG